MHVASSVVKAPHLHHCLSTEVYRLFQGQEEYQQRCDWIERQLAAMAEIFCIDVATYAVEDKHYRLTLYVSWARAEIMTMTEVIRHWHCIFDGTALSLAYEEGHGLKFAEIETLHASVELWRRRLIDVSWFMRVLNEAIDQQSLLVVPEGFVRTAVAPRHH